MIIKTVLLHKKPSFCSPSFSIFIVTKCKNDLSLAETLHSSFYSPRTLPAFLLHFPIACTPLTHSLTSHYTISLRVVKAILFFRHSIFSPIPSLSLSRHICIRPDLKRKWQFSQNYAYIYYLNHHRTICFIPFFHFPRKKLSD